MRLPKSLGRFAAASVMLVSAGCSSNAEPGSLPLIAEASATTTPSSASNEALSNTSATTPPNEQDGPELAFLSEYAAERFGPELANQSVARCLQDRGITMAGLKAGDGEMSVRAVGEIFGCAPDELAAAALSRAISSSDEQSCVATNQFRFISELELDDRLAVLRGAADDSLADEVIASHVESCDVTSSEASEILDSLG